MKYKAVFVKWKDAHCKNSTWCSEEDALGYGDVDFVVHHLCFLLKDDKKEDFILVCPRIGEYLDNAEMHFGDIMKIPRNWIEEIIYLDEYIYAKETTKRKRRKPL